ncbi:hypothetical protein POM88_045452 [Heracleum sosnowskyi]|uniref:Helitron helicase-like domain-containing protein n=1 Tax=Heracleum sosnowskyi TaxID=360622 RepID=A0AAD8M6F2_9APIA|nr:hypothetical protein POM88_045452 [Heracleum sosnowskyi]
MADTDGDAPPRKRGRPPNPVTDQVLEQRRLSRQRVNASRPKREGPSRKPGRPVRAMAEFIVDTRGLSTPTTSCGQGRDSTGTSGAVPSSQQSPPPNPSQVFYMVTPCPSLTSVFVPAENPTGVATRSVPSTDTNMDINLALGVAVLTRKRGRPPIAVNEEVLEQRRLSRQRVNASRSKRTTSESADQVRRAPDTPRQPNPLKENQSTGASNVLANKDQNTNSAQDMEHKNVVEDDHMGTISDTGTEIGDREHTIVVEDENMGAISNTGGTEIGESRRMRSSINKRKKEFMESNTILDLGKQEETCGFCRAQVWAAEFTGRHVGTGPKGYSICCGKGKVQLPLLRVPPSELDELISTRGTRSARFFNKSRIYNNIFAFCSFGGNVDHSVNTGKGPYVFRVSGRTYHSLGSLVPPDGLSPKFAQLYMYDSQEALTHRVNFPGKLGEVDPCDHVTGNVGT